MTEKSANLRLALALHERGLTEMADRAVLGHYSDFDSTLVFPKHTLVEELRRAGAEDLALRAMEGEWDD